MRMRGRRKTELSGTGAVRRNVAHDELRERGGVRLKICGLCSGVLILSLMS